MEMLQTHEVHKSVDAPVVEHVEHIVVEVPKAHNVLVVNKAQKVVEILQVHKAQKLIYVPRPE